MSKELMIRLYREGDLPQLVQLFFNTIHHPAQNGALEQFDSNHPSRLLEQEVLHNIHLIAEIENQIVGFGTIDAEGNLCHLMIHPSVQRQGYGNMLLSMLEWRAKRAELETIYAEATQEVRPFFERNGYSMMVERHKNNQDKHFLSYMMKKDL